MYDVLKTLKEQRNNESSEPGVIKTKLGKCGGEKQIQTNLYI